ncbi:MAG: ATP-binding protein, partial [Patescibacteria group bacterium]
KTYYMFYLIEQLVRVKGVNKNRILYINFEDQNLAEASVKDLPSILEVFYELFPENKKQKVWLFLDEIQNIPRWEIFVRTILDKEKAFVFLSGSSSKLLSREIATTLRGRTLSYLMLPFSLKEFLQIKNIPYRDYLSSEEKSQVKKAFNDYFYFGGYPEAVIYPQGKDKIINEIIEVTIYQDLIERHKIRNSKVIKMMFNHLVKSKEFSVHKFYNFLKSMNLKISKNTLYNYLEYFNDAFVFFPLKRFAYSIKNIEQSLSKIYTVDNGLITKIMGDDKSKLLENSVFLELIRRGFNINDNIFYYAWPNGSEVDFLIKKGKKVITLIQACFDVTDFATREREVKSLLKAGKELKCNDLLVITDDYQAKEKFGGKHIKFIPLWQWLLE